jgi:biopolymer transport protein ExbD
VVIRSSITLVPLVGVFIALIIVMVAPLLAGVEVQVPRKLDDIACGPDDRRVLVRVALHADSSADLAVGTESRHLDAPMVLVGVRTAVENNDRVEAIYLAPDDSVSWQQIVDAVSSLAHATAMPVVLDTGESG